MPHTRTDHEAKRRGDLSTLRAADGAKSTTASATPVTFSDATIIAMNDCPLNTIYLLPKGSRAPNLATGETLQLAPGYYVNPKQLGMITLIKR